MKLLSPYANRLNDARPHVDNIVLLYLVSSLPVSCKPSTLHWARFNAIIPPAYITIIHKVKWIGCVKTLLKEFFAIEITHFEKETIA